ncbi:MAG: bifunctional phosphopantothenoylcysteine decarboxylase/phosphopantothenate--cysteine ligase CoaBC [Candidatus Eremiobacteraeota bacterium]|nr:bifunctional phosphopantothenoylcysteine decarboxylase/phosphopantothenate--cysteine ligase CoaBC [Candidatus Eremiobacteraeota bacterium]
MNQQTTHNDSGPGAPQALAGRTLLVGVCGGIAAYKCAAIVSALRQQGADVHVIMTEAAQKFISALTFQALSNNDVHTDMFAAGSSWEIAHIGLVRRTDAMLLLNATANTLAKLAHGIADNLLTTCVLATRKPVIVAAAMNTQMLAAAATQENIQTLQSRGMEFVEPGAGFLACGEVGEGRLADERDIIAGLRQVLQRSQQFAGQRVMITAGATREFLDPARFLSNPASGRMGFALAAEAAARGAQVVLISGPSELRAPAGVEIIRVTSAREMAAAVSEHLPGVRLFIGAAAVADFRPRSVETRKVKKESAASQIVLERNPDIIAEVATRRPPGCFVVGFAAETEDLESNARAKLGAKQLDCIVANRIGGEESAFARGDSEALILWGDDGREALSRRSKSAVAAAVLDRVAKLQKAGA